MKLIVQKENELKKMSDKEKILAFFPLNISLLPGEDIPLRIFEPRFKQLINDCNEENMNFGIPYVNKSEIQVYGIECKIKQIVARNSRGEMVIVVTGISNFETIKFLDSFPGKLYGGGVIQSLKNDFRVHKEQLQKMLANYSVIYDPAFLKDYKTIMVNDVARALNLSSEDKYKFISLKEAARKEHFLKAHLAYLIKLRQQEKQLNNDYMLN